MEYTINWFKAGQLEGTESSKGFPFNHVKEHAEQFVDTGIADRVEVRDAADNLVLQFPRTMQKA
jgi:hypothetical protein